jgi:hypothetical protein
LIFTKSELEGEAKKVVERMKEFYGSRLEIILLGAIRGRAHSLNIVRDESTISWIDFSLDPFHDPAHLGAKQITLLFACCFKDLPNLYLTDFHPRAKGKQS